MEGNHGITKKQTEQIVSNFLDQGNGLNKVLVMMLIEMILFERQEFLKTDNPNKGNGNYFYGGC